MGRLERRLRKLEDRAEARGASPAQVEEARLQREWAEALSRLSDDDLEALGEVIEAAEERMGDSGTLVNLYEVADERGRRALDAFEEILVNLSRGGEPPSAEAPQ